MQPGQPCGGERLLLMFDRWRKLGKAFYSDKRGEFDISKVPDIYDSAKYDSIHNRHLGLGFREVYQTARILANAVIPNEYGIDPSGKLRIGAKICAALLGKILADLGNMREESIATAHVQDAPELSPFDAYPDTSHEITHSQPSSMGSGHGGGGSGAGDGSGHVSATAATASAAAADAGSPKTPARASCSSMDSGPAESAFSTAAALTSDGSGSVASGGVPASSAPPDVNTGLPPRPPPAVSAAAGAAAEPAASAPPARAEGRSTGGDSSWREYDPSGDGGAAPAGQSPRSPTSDSDDAETMHRLCPTYATDINSPLRHVRTRIYFTSESHVHSLINVLRYCQLGTGQATVAERARAGLVSAEAQQRLREVPELDYLTHIVMRLYENKQVPVESPQRFLVEVQFSPGANYDPFSLVPMHPHVLPVLPRYPLHEGAPSRPDETGDGSCPTMADLEALLKPMSTPAKASTYTYTMF